MTVTSRSSKHPREFRVGLVRFVIAAGHVWVMELGPVAMRITWPPTVDPCGGSGRWWWGFGR